MSTPTIKDVLIENENDRFLVVPIWNDVTDRPFTGGYSCGENRSIAERLKRAMLAGAAFDNVSIETDINGKTYISADLQLRMRCANADLARMGY